MQVVCTIKRPAGTEITFNDGTAYHFKPADAALKPGTPEFIAAPHVADVENEDHLAAFIAAKSAYRLYSPGKPVPKAVSDIEELQKQNAEAERQRRAAEAASQAAKASGEKLVLPYPPFADMKKAEIIKWAQDNLPAVEIDPKLPVGGIIQAIRDHSIDANQSATAE
jgi:hypothetical protein